MPNTHRICLHGRRHSLCKECKGSAICEHSKQRSYCKQCGTSAALRNGGFSPTEIREMGAVQCCQFPGCSIQAELQANGRRLNSDHLHDGQPINPENYRGEVCFGHNVMLSDWDKHPEWASAEAREYMRRRPYSRLKQSIAA
jgi:hypothetical protein